MRVFFVPIIILSISLAGILLFHEFGVVRMEQISSFVFILSNIAVCFGLAYYVVKVK